MAIQLFLIAILIWTLIYFEFPISNISFGAFIVLRIVQICLWIQGINFLSNENSFQFSLKNRVFLILICSFIIDIIFSLSSSVTNLASNADWKLMALQLKDRYPFSSNFLAIYGDYGGVFASFAKLINPIPFGIAVFTWPAFVSRNYNK